MSKHQKNQNRISLLESPGFVLMHFAIFFVIWAGISWFAIIICLASYFVRMFGITAGYHRYFSHRAFKTSRVFQFVLACLGASAAQQGPLWWAAHHRNHHKHPDTINDIHSPVLQGFWWSHVGWLLCPKYGATDLNAVPDLVKYRELRFINRFHVISPVVLAISLFLFGAWLARLAPSLGTSGFQVLVWGFVISTVLLYHGTFTVNSLAHQFGSRRFGTKDNSRNNLFVALITLGEGWHNNHHSYPSSERQGFNWWEIDISHGILKMLSWTGIVWNLRTPPKDLRAQF
jgi:stearoyl-CoA desaturase (delta-9 desaturase)